MNDYLTTLNLKAERATMGTHAVSIMEPPEWQETEAPFLKALESADLPGEDGEPMENERERIQTSLGIESLDHH